VASCVRSFAEALDDLGASFTEVELPGWEDAVDACSRLILEEALALYGERRCRASPAARGRHQAAARWRQTWERRPRAAAAGSGTLGRRDGGRLGGVDLLLTPTIPVEAPLAAAQTPSRRPKTSFPTFVFAFAHVPALSLPCGTSAGGAPVGAQVASARGRDGLVLRAGAAVQAATDWHRSRAPWPFIGAAARDRRSG
jgi:Asp-tRNA(Asn)/Glu-tRNA(Gln) amidotransferase A subunit family amidase